MMSTAPPFMLDRDQAGRLQTYIQDYRKYAFSSLLPSTERNTMLRLLQTIQGKLIEIKEQPADRFQLVLTEEEKKALKDMVADLLRMYARQPESKERLATLADLAGLQNSLHISDTRR